MADPKSYPYVAAGANGLIKVGLTSNPATRREKLKQLFREKGDALSAFAHFGPAPEAYDIEDALIRHCCEICDDRHSGHEWFVGGDFAALTVFAQAEIERRASLPPFPIPTPEQIRAWQLRDWREQQARTRRIAAYHARRSTDNRETANG
jgi:hypothetical protein